MIEEEGIVMEVSDGMAKVAVLAKSACEKCASAGVCHPGGEDSYMEAANPLGAKKGQKVKVVLAPQVFLENSEAIGGREFILHSMHEPPPGPRLRARAALRATDRRRRADGRRVRRRGSRSARWPAGRDRAG